MRKTLFMMMTLALFVSQLIASPVGVEQARQLGIEWTTAQCRELYAHGIHNIHFYTVSAVDSVAEITRRLMRGR